MAYHDDGRYQRDLERAVKPAYRWLEREAGSADRLAVVFDIDETALSNWPQLSRSQFCYDGDEWAAWIAEASAEPLSPVLDLYRHARSLGYGVFFITGRREARRAPTEQNLRAVGYDLFEELVCKPADLSVPSAVDYKTPERARIESAGWRIVLNVGDQQSDLDGGHSAYTVLLPNPFYDVR